QPPTLVDRDTPPVVARPDRRLVGAQPAGRPGGTRRGRRGRGVVGGLVLGVLVLLAGVMGVLASGGDPRHLPTEATAPVDASAAVPPVTTTPPPTPTPTASRSPARSSTPAPAPTTTAPDLPATARAVVTEFLAVLFRAQLAGDIDGRAAEELRDRLTKLVASKPKDVDGRVEDLTERIGREIDRDRLAEETGERLRDLVTAYGELRGGGADDDDDDDDD
ncbi:hypothetical protein ABT336_27360, partial [Micromonospora sp. NPDC000207]